MKQLQQQLEAATARARLAASDSESRDTGRLAMIAVPHLVSHVQSVAEAVAAAAAEGGAAGLGGLGSASATLVQLADSACSRCIACVPQVRAGPPGCRPPLSRAVHQARTCGRACRRSSRCRRNQKGTWCQSVSKCRL